MFARREYAHTDSLSSTCCSRRGREPGTGERWRQIWFSRGHFLGEDDSHVDQVVMREGGSLGFSNSRGNKDDGFHCWSGLGSGLNSTSISNLSQKLVCNTWQGLFSTKRTFTFCSLSVSNPSMGKSHVGLV